jgi:hypothetical protein
MFVLLTYTEWVVSNSRNLRVIKKLPCLLAVLYSLIITIHCTVLASELVNTILDNCEIVLEIRKPFYERRSLITLAEPLLEPPNMILQFRLWLRLLR